MPRRVDIETTIPSFYYSNRQDPENIARCGWTREWWDRQRVDYELYTSPLVIKELSDGEHPNKNEKVQLMKEVSILDHRSEVDEVGAVYIRRFLMPARTCMATPGDALHMAFAYVYRCDILLTWNCAHLANLNKRDHLIAINSQLGLSTPWVVTPLEVLEGFDDE